MTDHLRGSRFVKSTLVLRLYGREAGRWYAQACDETLRVTDEALVDLGPRPELDRRADAIDRACGGRHA